MAFLAILALRSTPSHVETFRIEGVERQAIVQPGEGAAPRAGRPLVLGFHGHGGSMRFSERRYAIHDLWPEAIVVYPEGLPTKGMTDPEGKKNGWQQKPGDDGDRDVKFVDAILAGVKGYDPRRVYAMGHSNGGRFTYVLWSVRGDRFAAYGASGSPAVLLSRGFRPAPAFVTAGESDPIVPFRGQKATIDALGRLDGIDFSRATRQGYVTLAPGRDGLELGTYVSPAGHAFPPDAVAATLALFKRHPL